MRVSAFLAVSVLALAATTAASAQSAAVREITVLETSAAGRARYLAESVIWEARDLPSPDAIMEGPPGRFAFTREEANPVTGLPCTYESSGAGSGGATEKFTCRLSDGRRVRVKYYNGDSRRGNREVFAEVIATRLFWALGFDADATYPVTINCLDCPADPMSGHGPRASRKLLGSIEPHFPGAMILSGHDQDQGWTFGELESAIDRLPAGALKTRQRRHFDALSLLAVFVQHGDRKRSQQRLVCHGGLDEQAGELRQLNGDDAGTQAIPALFERRGMAACRQPLVTIQDLGATFGGAGQLTASSTATAHLKSWAKEPVFAPRIVDPKHLGQKPACHGNITISGAAGADGRENPRIGEAGRQHLAALLDQLTDAHIRAIFDAGRIDELEGDEVWRDAGVEYRGVDAWVAVFKHKRAEIADARCID